MYFYEIDDPEFAFKSSCKFDVDKDGNPLDVGSYMIDSSITELLVIFELSLPIQ
jgi:hypothetical protein